MALAPMTAWAENETGAKTQERLESKVSVTENDESNGTVTGVSVVDGTDGYTPVTNPKPGQKLTANIQTSEGEIGSYPVNADAQYEWYYEGSDTILGTGPVYTVTDDNLSKKLCVKVSVKGYAGEAIWKADGKVGQLLTLKADKTSLRGGGTVTLTVGNLKDGDTATVVCNDITVTKNADGTFRASLPNKTQTYKFTATADGYESAVCEVSVTRKPSGGGSSSGGSSSSSSSKKYTVSASVDSNEHGKVTMSPEKAAKGDKVTVIVTPDKGYEIEKVKATDANGDKITLTDQGNGKYTFTMPASKVEIKATFAKAQDEPVVNEEAKSIILTINQRVASVFGKPVINDVAPIIRNERTMLPLRFVAENLGATVTWDAAAQQVTILPN